MRAESVAHREYFDSVAGNWDGICRHDRGKISMILDLIGLAEGDRVLDVGTGTGILVPFLLERIGRTGAVHGVDISAEMLEVARSKQKVPNVRFIHGDILYLPLPKEGYDHVICYSVFPHLGEKRIVIGVLARCLKAGGRLTICHSSGREEINRHHQSSHPAVANDYLPRLDALKEVLVGAGLESYVSVDSDNMYLVSVRKPAAGEKPAGRPWHYSL